MPPNYSLRPPLRPMRNPSLDDPMGQLRSAQTVNMSPELFEKLFLQSSQSQSARPSTRWSSDNDSETKPYEPPHGHGHGHGHRSVGNPTPIALVGIVIALTPLSCNLMGLVGAGGGGAAGIPTYYFFGGLLLIIAALLEWYLGNTFPSVVFSAYGAFFLSFGGTLTPAFNAFAAYAPPGQGGEVGLKTQGFNASFAWILVWMSVLSLLFFVCSLRTNIVLVVVFFTLIGVFGTLAGGYFILAGGFERNASSAATFIKAGGVCAFIASLAAWWNLLSVLLEAVDFPLRIPLGDLSGWLQPVDRRRSMA